MSNDSPTILVIFGISGQLATRKLLPALIEVEKRRQLPDSLQIFGTSRWDMKVADLARSLSGSLKSGDKQAAKRLLSRIRLVKMDPTQADGYPHLHAALEGHDQKNGTNSNLLFHIALPPDNVASTIEQLIAHKLNKAFGNGAEGRILIEKPYAGSVRSFKNLAKMLGRSYKDRQIYWLDHRLSGSLTNQIISLRQNNPLLASAWSARHIKAIDIVDLSGAGSEKPAAHCARRGTLIDVVGSTLLPLLGLTTLHIPARLNEDKLARARLDLLKTIRPIRRRRARAAVRGQYRSYRRESGQPTATADTFASVQITIDQSAWRHAHIRLTAGQALDRTESRISIMFSNFKKDEKQNLLVLHIGPDAGLTLTLAAAKPGGEALETTALNETFAGAPAFATPYGEQLYDAISGRRGGFLTSDELMACWHIVGPLSRRWSKNTNSLAYYRSGSRPADILSK